MLREKRTFWRKLLSLPSWERGLKSRPYAVTRAPKVAPLVGAWIEITRIFVRQATMVSLPSWERGLKFALEQVKDKEEPSLPSWERGLKYLH